MENNSIMNWDLYHEFNKTKEPVAYKGELYIIRGLPGAGKSTLAKKLSDNHLEADQYFMKDGVYEFDATKLYQAHMWCQDSVRKLMSENKGDICVSNTFTTGKELKPYIELAKEFNYNFTVLIVENRHGNSNIHDVNDETLDKMEDRLRNNIKLR